MRAPSSARVLAWMLALAAACADPSAQRSSIRVDAGACFRKALTSECGDAASAQLAEGALTCLRLQGLDGSGGTLTFAYDPATGELARTVGAAPVRAKVGDALDVELYVLRAGAADCPAFHETPDCAAHDACLLSFGREALRVEGVSSATLVYGGEEGRRCAPTSRICRYLLSTS